MKSPGRKKLNRLILTALLLGTVLIVLSMWCTARFGSHEPSLAYLILRTVDRLGEAILIAGLIALGFERALSEERIREIEQIFRLHRQLQKFGFRATYANRQELFDEIFERQLSRTQSELKILGICVSLFKESERSPASEKRMGREQVIETLASLIEAGCTVQVLLLKRYPSEEELKQYGVENMDLYYVRERDEDKEDEFTHGKRLKKIANRSLDGWIHVLLRTAQKAKSLKADERHQILSRLQVREYLAIPSVSVFVLDERMYVTPYLFKRHCSSVPAFQVGGKESPLYREYRAHFSETWNDPFTTPAIPAEFVDLLVEAPDETLDDFEEKYAEVSKELNQRAGKEPSFGEGPEYWRASEKTIDALLRKSK